MSQALLLKSWGRERSRHYAAAAALRIGETPGSRSSASSSGGCGELREQANDEPPALRQLCACELRDVVAAEGRPIPCWPGCKRTQHHATAWDITYTAADWSLYRPGRTQRHQTAQSSIPVRGLLVPRSKVRSLHGPSACALQNGHFLLRALCHIDPFGQQGGQHSRHFSPRARSRMPRSMLPVSGEESVREGAPFPLRPFRRLRCLPMHPGLPGEPLLRADGSGRPGGP